VFITSASTHLPSVLTNGHSSLATQTHISPSAQLTWPTSQWWPKSKSRNSHVNEVPSEHISKHAAGMWRGEPPFSSSLVSTSTPTRHPQGGSKPRLAQPPGALTLAQPLEWVFEEAILDTHKHTHTHTNHKVRRIAVPDVSVYKSNELSTKTMISKLCCHQNHLKSF
jgi:hypothetical protein